MNEIIEKAAFEVAEADALMFAFDKAYTCIEVLPEERERADKAVYAFYSMWEHVKNALELLSEVK